jgi:hypothetical protein
MIEKWLFMGWFTAESLRRREIQDRYGCTQVNGFPLRPSASAVNDSGVP